MSKTIVHTNNAPGAIGPYSQGVVVNGFIFTAGQVGLIPGTRTLAQGAIQEQTNQALTNLRAVLEAAGSSLENVVKTTVYLKDMNDFAAMNETYASFFSHNPPARTTVEAARLPLDALVEIEAVALIE